MRPEPLSRPPGRASIETVTQTGPAGAGPRPDAPVVTWPRGARTVALGAAVLAVGVAGAALGLLVAGSTRADVGPFVLELSLRPALSGSSVVQVPPLGELELDTHAGPVALVAQVVELREQAARDLVADPRRLADVGRDVDRGVRAALLRLAVRAALVTVLGATALGLVVFRRPWRTAMTGAAGLVTLLVAGGTTAVTFDEQALATPRYRGLLASAPTAIGDVRDVVGRIDAYGQALGRLVTNVSELYATASALPTFAPDDDTLRVLHVSDLHLSPSAYDVIAPVVEQFGVDVVVDTGDITDFGSVPEDRYVAAIGRVGVPYVFVRGNHDSPATQAAVARQPGAVVLDGPAVVEVAGLRLLGRGDPRFTPDKTTRDDDAPRALLEDLGVQLRGDVLQADVVPDVIAVHDPLAAERALGAAPLVLAGHAHERRATQRDGALLLVQGSTGGAGLRGLEGEDATPIDMSVVYLDRTTRRVLAYDDITLGGLGASSARIERTVVAPPAVAAPAG